MSQLILFDIDCTLIDTGGAGMRSLTEATREIFGGDGPPLDLAGSTDSGIVRGIFSHFGAELDEAAERAYYDVYLGRLAANLGSGEFEGVVLPGVRGLIEKLEDAGAVLGLLTGNIEDGAVAKAVHYGLAEHFQFGAYGDDHWDRNLLGPIAIERANHHRGAEFGPDDTVVIGDTHKDVACAKACGARCIAVATGNASYDDLVACEPELVVEDLCDPRVGEFLGLSAG